MKALNKTQLEREFENIRIRCRIRRMRVDGRRIRKEKVADTKISGHVTLVVANRTSQYFPAPSKIYLHSMINILQKNQETLVLVKM